MNITINLQDAAAVLSKEEYVILQMLVGKVEEAKAEQCTCPHCEITSMLNEMAEAHQVEEEIPTPKSAIIEAIARVHRIPAQNIKLVEIEPNGLQGLMGFPQFQKPGKGFIF